jgi:hypothetical protein
VSVDLLLERMYCTLRPFMFVTRRLDQEVQINFRRTFSLHDELR